MAELRFTSTIRILGINPYVAVSAARAGKLRNAWRKPMHVLAGNKARFMARDWASGS